MPYLPPHTTEPEEKRKMPAWFCDWKNSPPYNEQTHGELRLRIARLLEKEAGAVLPLQYAW